VHDRLRGELAEISRMVSGPGSLREWIVDRINGRPEQLRSRLRWASKYPLSCSADTNHSTLGRSRGNPHLSAALRAVMSAVPIATPWKE
jgi:hypothetical protein